MTKSLEMKYAILKKFPFYFSVVIILAYPLLDLFTPGFFLGHDTQDHVARIANFYQNLKEGVLIPRWAGNLNWGYGHPILMFLYPLPSYIASLFIFLGLSFVDATKFVFAFGYVLSGISMFVFVSHITNKKAAFLAAVLYTYAPYRFVDLYVRGAIGENFFFIWPPLVLLSFYVFNKSGKISYFLLGSISIACSILSHNALMLMYLPLLVLYFLLTSFFFCSTAKRFMTGVFMWILGFGISAFFWIPAFFEGKYTLRDIVTAGETIKRFEALSRIVWSSWNYGGTGQFSVQLGILQWLMMLLTPVLLFLIFKEYKKHIQNKNLLQDVKMTFFIKSDYTKLKILHDFGFSALLFISCIVGIVLIVSISKPVYEFLSILQKFQFPWRFLSLSIISPAILGGYLLYYAPKKYQTTFLVIIVFIQLVITSNYIKADGYVQKDNSYFSGIYEGTTDTGESAPIWSVRFMEKSPENYTDVIDGKARIEAGLRTSIRHEYKVKVESEKARILENTLYFPGWNIYVDGNKLPLYEVNWQDPQYRGLMTYYVSEGEHVVLILFGETRVRMISNIISGISAVIIIIIILICWLVLKIRQLLKHENNKKLNP